MYTMEVFLLQELSGRTKAGVLVQTKFNPP